ncbi:hypothetical protein Scep_018928 [Stephania cephalantha]|uniref:FAR1 domain-containing protein n=1 Tax=Stephania cephalantha TaxID=152367 RepID=A0AAP0I9S0_9MAGN
MDCTIGLEDGVRGLLEEEIEEIHDSDEGLSEEDIIEFNLNAKVPEEGMIFGTLDEAKLAWLRYARNVGFGPKVRSSHRKHNVIVKRVFACNKEGNYKSRGIYHKTLGSRSNCRNRRRFGGWKQIKISFLDFDKLVIDVDDPIEIDNDD